VRGISYLEIAQLSELLPTVFEFTNERFGLVMDDLMCANVSSLSETLATDLAVVRPLTGVAAFMSLVTFV
jgi:hypothetical protein